MQTSQFLDPFGYSRVGLNATGPLVSKKDTLSKTKTPIMGYFLAGDFTYNEDGAPNATGIYKVNDDMIDFLKETRCDFPTTGQVSCLTVNS